MGSELSRPIDYTCHDIGHTWSPSCTYSALEVMGSTFKESLKIYSTVYFISSLLKGKRPTQRQFKSLMVNILRSSTFLSYNSFGFLFYVCLTRKLLGFYNYYTLAFMNAFLASLTAIFVERPSRRPMLMVYVCNVASESVIDKLVREDKLPRVPFGETLAFAMATGIIADLYVKRLKAKENESGNEKNLHGDLTFMAMRHLLGPIKLNESECSHEGSCMINALKASRKPFFAGTAFELVLLLLKSLTKQKSFSFFIKSVMTLKLGLFLGSFSGIFKLSKCLMLNLTKRECPSGISGFLAGLSMVFYRSKSLAIYTIWKTLEVLFKELWQRPTPPFVIESIYAIATATLFHLAIFEPHNLKSSYYRFLKRVTANRFNEINRLILDHEYGTVGAESIPFVPHYRDEFISDRMKSTWPVLLGKIIV